MPIFVMRVNRARIPPAVRGGVSAAAIIWSRSIGMERAWFCTFGGGGTNRSS